MLCCYQPERPPLGTDNADRCTLMILLYRRYWLKVDWIGMQTDTPRIVRASVQDMSGRYHVSVSPDRLCVLGLAAFQVWYRAHWDRFIRSAPREGATHGNT